MRLERMAKGALALNLSVLAGGTSVPALPVNGQLGQYVIRTTVDSEEAQYYQFRINSPLTIAQEVLPKLTPSTLIA